MTFTGLVSTFVKNVQLNGWRDHHPRILLSLLLCYSLLADTSIAATGQKASINRLSSFIGLTDKHIVNKKTCAFTWCWTTLLGLIGDCISSVLPRMKLKVPAIALIKYNCNFVIDVITTRTKSYNLCKAFEPLFIYGWRNAKAFQCY